MTYNIRTKISALLTVVVLLLSIFCSCRRIISLDEIPDYGSSAYVDINGGDPFFKNSEITDKAFEKYSELDALGRCGVAFACIGIEIMPTEERESIASVTPTGWEYAGMSNNNQYDFIENGYVYNRCHLIGHQLAGENDNDKNLITGTRYMNIEGMLPFENAVADYVEATENHVMYRVTPIFKGLDYVARGVLMEAYSVEDNGRGISFCVYAYNVQPGVTIDYFTGVNVRNGNELPEISDENDNRDPTSDFTDGIENGEICDFVLNTNSKKFHRPGKSCAESISDKNKELYTGTREDLIKKGYEACRICKP